MTYSVYRDRKTIPIQVVFIGQMCRAAQRIDQALYDLVVIAKHDILLVTFAATRIERLTDALLSATPHIVQVRLVLEFEQSSSANLTDDAFNRNLEIGDSTRLMYFVVKTIWLKNTHLV